MGSSKPAVPSAAPPHSARAVALLAEISADPDARLLTGVSGAAGSGKSALLDDIESQYRAAGVLVRRGHADVDRYPVTGRRTILVDDAHHLNERALTRVHSLIQDSDVNLIVAYGLWPQPPALQRLAAALEHYHPRVLLGPLPREEVAAHVSRVVGGPASDALVDHVSELTGGMPWLVRRVVDAIDDDARRAFGATVKTKIVVDRLGHDFDRVDGSLRELLLAIAVGFDLSGHLPFDVSEPGGVDTLVSRATAAGLLLPDGRLVPLVRQALLAVTPAYQVRALQLRLVDTCVSEGRSLDDIAGGLARGGLKDPRIAEALERAGDRALSTRPDLASILYDEAEAAGFDESATAARRAQAVWAAGDFDRATHILDGLLARDDPPDVNRGVDVAAAVWAQRGMLARSAEMYRWLGPARAGASAPLAALAMIGTGDRAGSEIMLGVAGTDDSPTLTNVAVKLLGQGIRESLQDESARALPSLIRASDMMTASGAIVPLPEVPAALAAIVALHSGEVGVAASVIDGALNGNQCGPTARPRLLLLRAWAAMQGDQPERARAAITEAKLRGDLAPREEFLLGALEVGLARRADDAPALTRAWQRARESVLHVPVDLYSLLPLGELMIAAARVRDADRLESHLTEAWSLLARLGDPILWSASLHWSAIQAAILAERPGDLAPHAAALVRAAPQNHLAAMFSAGGRAWLAVLAANFNVASVEAAARGLASVGQIWEGARLAGHAAARADDRKSMARLLACARDLRPGAAASGGDQPEYTPAVRAHPTRDASGLSAREREVARLVLAGKTYWEIGEAIFISPRTVEHHVARIRRRLGVESRSELLVQLRRALEA